MPAFVFLPRLMSSSVAQARQRMQEPERVEYIGNLMAAWSLTRACRPLAPVPTGTCCSKPLRRLMVHASEPAMCFDRGIEASSASTASCLARHLGSVRICMCRWVMGRVRSRKACIGNGSCQSQWLNCAVQSSHVLFLWRLVTHEIPIWRGHMPSLLEVPNNLFEIRFQHHPCQESTKERLVFAFNYTVNALRHV